ncbi:MAG: hypothetical protein ACYDA0_15520 [Candidatus Dormibacteraceae bacterium]
MLIGKTGKGTAVAALKLIGKTLKALNNVSEAWGFIPEESTTVGVVVLFDHLSKVPRQQKSIALVKPEAF